MIPVVNKKVCNRILFCGGGIANTFIASEGHVVGKSLYEDNLLGEAARLKQAAKAKGGDIPIPTDVVVGSEFSQSAIATVKDVNAVSDGEMIFDIGPKTVQAYSFEVSGR